MSVQTCLAAAVLLCCVSACQGDAPKASDSEPSRYLPLDTFAPGDGTLLAIRRGVLATSQANGKGCAALRMGAETLPLRLSEGFRLRADDLALYKGDTLVAMAGDAVTATGGVSAKRTVLTGCPGPAGYYFAATIGQSG